MFRKIGKQKDRIQTKLRAMFKHKAGYTIKKMRKIYRHYTHKGKRKRQTERHLALSIKNGVIIVSVASVLTNVIKFI